jgi:BRO family, N-terminal domain
MRSGDRRVKQEQKPSDEKTVPSGQTENSGGDPEENQPSSAGPPRRVEADGAIVGEYFFQNQRVRTIAKDGETWFFAADVCEVLGHTNPRKAIDRQDPDEKGVSSSYTLGGTQTMNVINESGLYALVFSSRKSEARNFRRWVTGEVLPAIRRTGSYSPDGGQSDQDAPIVLPRSDMPFRYIVMAAPGHPPHIRQLRWETAMAEWTSLDCQGLCYALKAIEVWWQRCN